jgi:lipopolysaccharide transport system permease protein
MSSIPTAKARPTVPERSASRPRTPTDPGRVDFDRTWTLLTANGSRRPLANAANTRRLLFAWARRDIRTRYRESAGRGLWNLIQPVAMLLIYSFVFTQIFGADGAGLPYITMAWSGIVVWQYVQHGIVMGMWSFIHEQGTLPKVWFPRIVVPMTHATAPLLDLGVGLLLTVVVGAVQGITPSITYLALPVPLALVLLWTYAVGLLVAPLSVFIRDLTTFVPLLVRLGFFASPVMYSADYVPEDFKWVADINPVAVGITGVRDTMLSGVWPQWGLIGIHLAIAAVLLAAGVVYLRRVEDRLVDAL